MAIKRGAEVKKVKAYPFDGQLEIAPGKFAPISVWRLSPVGAILSIQKVVLVVGKEYNISFSLPVFNYSISVRVKIMKTRDQVHEEPGPKMRVDRRAEVRFINPTMNQKDAIEQFMRAIRQSQ